MAAHASEEKIRALLADDDEVFLASLWDLIAREHELSVVGTAPDGLVARLMAVGATA